jgi:Flagellar biosynthesis protein, FliO
MGPALRPLWPGLLGLAAAAVVLALIGPTLQGAAAALLCAAGAAALHLSSRAAPTEPCLRVVGHVRLAPRVELAVVEAEGRRFLVATGATVTLLPPEPGS